MDAPVARLVGIGQRRAPNRLAKPHVITLGFLGRQANLNVTQAFSEGQLGERHRPELLRTGQFPDAFVAAVACNIAGEGRPGQEVHELGEQCLAGVHEHLRAKARMIAQFDCCR
ncbi:hypothetical protein D9M68_858550 [compost metagenome]